LDLSFPSVRINGNPFDLDELSEIQDNHIFKDDE
jgi:hypothetical protein